MKAKFYNGVEAKSHEVTLTFGARGIVIQDSHHHILDSWDYSELDIDLQKSPGQWALLKCKNKPLKRLILESKEDYHQFTDHMPFKPHDKKIGKMVATGVAAFIVIILVLKQVSWEVFLPFMSRDWDNQVGNWAEVYLDDHEKQCTSPVLVKIMNRISHHLLTHVSFREKVNIQIVIVNNPSIHNAMALPNGKIYVYTGLLNNVRTPEELMGILAHEMGHIYYRHGMVSLLRNITLLSAAKLIEITAFSGFSSLVWVTNMAKTLMSLHYSRDLESQADEFALNLLQKMTISSKGFADFFDSQKNHKGESKYLSTHPLDQDRLDVIRRHPTYHLKGQEFLTPPEWVVLKMACTSLPLNQ